MAGLAPHAVNFFKFLLILALYTIVMTLFVRIFLFYRSSRLFTSASAEFPPRSIYTQWRSRAPAGRAERAVPDDVRGVLHPPQFDPAGAAVVAVVVPAQVCARGALGERGQLGAPDTGYPTRRARGRLRFAHHEHRASLSFFFFFFRSKLNLDAVVRI